MKQIEQTITSIDVAEMVCKDHNKLLRDIREYEGQLSQSNIGQSEFFVKSEREVRGKKYPCYLVTKNGCEFIAHKLTGVKGTAFTARYIEKFHDMEQQIYNPMSTEERIRTIAQGTTELYQKIDGVKQDLEDFKQDLPLLGIECQRITRAKNHKVVPILGGKNAPAYKDNRIRGKVYSDIQKEICRQFGVDSYKEIKRCQVDKAIDIIKGYELPMALEEQVTDCNAQMSL